MLNILPIPERVLEQTSSYGDFVPGGRYIRLDNFVDVTGMTVQHGHVSCKTNNPFFSISPIICQPTTKNSGKIIRCNLIRKKVGWKWITEPYPDTSVLCAIETKNQHFYCLELIFENGVTLSRYADNKTEPKLRPTTYGVCQFKEIVGQIDLRKKIHPVFDQILIT